jgi:hypothetical protein
MSVREPEPFDGDEEGRRVGELLLGYAESVDVLVDRVAAVELNGDSGSGPVDAAGAVEERAVRGEEVRPRPSVRWREVHPEAFGELKCSYAVIGHSAVLMVLSLSLIGTALTVGHLHWAEWLEAVVRMAASLGAVGCGTVALWRVVRALWRALRALRAARRGEPGASVAGAGLAA